jgi:predicted MFS family arabinose efflux permease
VYFGGGGLGILTSGLVVPLLIQSPAAWRWGWIGLGLLALVATALSWIMTRNVSDTRQQSASRERWSPVPFIPIFMAYLLFACGYIAYMTFVVALMRGQSIGTAQIALFWSVLGAAAMLAPRVWGAALSQAKGGRTLAVVLAVVGVGAALPIVATSFPIMLLSALVFGLSFLIVPTAITAFVRYALPHAAWPSGIAVFTVVFAAGQIVGPLVSGALADLLGGLQISLGFSAGLLLLAASCSWLQRDPMRRA